MDAVCEDLAPLRTSPWEKFFQIEDPSMWHGTVTPSYLSKASLPSFGGE
jgi:hypothetical protein